jgi:hypothetical protein
MSNHLLLPREEAASLDNSATPEGGPPQQIAIFANGELIGTFDPNEAEYLGDSGSPDITSACVGKAVCDQLSRLPDGRFVLFRVTVVDSQFDIQTYFGPARLLTRDEAIRWMGKNNVQPPRDLLEQLGAKDAPPFKLEWLDEHFKSEDQKSVLRRLLTGGELPEAEVMKLVWGPDTKSSGRIDDLLKKLRGRINDRFEEIAKQVGRLYTITSKKRKWSLVCANPAPRAV